MRITVVKLNMATTRIDTSEMTVTFKQSNNRLPIFRSVDYLKSLLSFPKHLIVEHGMLEALTEEVIQHHDEVQDVTQAAAEELYM